MDTFLVLFEIFIAENCFVAQHIFISLNIIIPKSICCEMSQFMSLFGLIWVFTDPSRTQAKNNIHVHRCRVPSYGPVYNALRIMGSHYFHYFHYPPRSWWMMKREVNVEFSLFRRNIGKRQNLILYVIFCQIRDPLVKINGTQLPQYEQTWQRTTGL